MSLTLSCLACGKELESAIPDDLHSSTVNQPSEGTSFQSHGQYGSTVWDPFDGHYIEINICDDCLRKAGQQRQVLYSQDYRIVTPPGEVSRSERIPPDKQPPMQYWAYETYREPDD